MWQVILSKKAQEDLDKLTQIGLFNKVKKLIAILRENPFLNPPHSEKLVGNLKGCYSRRINIKLKLIKRSAYGFRNFENFRLRCQLNWHINC